MWYLIRWLALLAAPALLCACQTIPKVTGFAPHNAVRCDTVTFSGVGMFGALDDVSFNGVKAVGAHYNPGASTATPPDSFRADVPQGATSGPITVKFSSGSSIIALPATQVLTPAFTIDPNPPVPTLRDFAVMPLSVHVGDNVMVRWAIDGATSVSLSGQSVATAGTQSLPMTTAGNQPITLTAFNHNPCFSMMPRTQTVNVARVTGQFHEAIPQSSGAVTTPNGQCTVIGGPGNPGYLHVKFQCGTKSDFIEVRTSADFAAQAGVSVVPPVGGFAIAGNHTAIVFSGTNPGNAAYVYVSFYVIELPSMKRHRFDLTQGIAHIGSGNMALPGIPARAFFSPDETLITTAGGFPGACGYCRDVHVYDVATEHQFSVTQGFLPQTGDVINVYVADDPNHPGKQQVTGNVEGKALNPIPLN